MKYLILLAFGLWLGWRAQRWVQALQAGSRSPSPTSRTAVVETLVQCERCGVHVPQGQMRRTAQGRYRCADPCPEAADA